MRALRPRKNIYDPKRVSIDNSSAAHTARASYRARSGTRLKLRFACFRQVPAALHGALTEAIVGRDSNIDKKSISAYINEGKIYG